MASGPGAYGTYLLASVGSGLQPRDFLQVQQLVGGIDPHATRTRSDLANPAAPRCGAASRRRVPTAIAPLHRGLIHAHEPLPQRRPRSKPGRGCDGSGWPRRIEELGQSPLFRSDGGPDEHGLVLKLDVTSIVQTLPCPWTGGDPGVYGGICMVFGISYGVALVVLQRRS